MKNFKSVLLICITTVLLSGCGSSQAPASTETPSTDRDAQREARQQQRQQLLADLNLRDDQKIEVEKILKESQEQMQAIRNNSGGDRRQMFQEMRTLTQETDNKLKTILDDEQYKIYETFKEKQREQMRSQMQNRRGNRGRF